MDYKKKLKKRLCLAILYIILGLLGYLSRFFGFNEVLSLYGAGLFGCGVLFAIRYIRALRNDEIAKKLSISETDERNVLINSKAQSTALVICIVLFGIFYAVLEMYNMSQMANGILASFGLLMITYCICYLVYRKKL